MRPRLASWEKSTHPDQLRLGEYLAAVEVLLTPALAREDPLALQLDVGLGPAGDLLVHRDLDNFLEPLARRLPETVCSYWARKSAAEDSSVTVGVATEAGPPELERWSKATATPLGSPAKEGWKQSICEQLSGQVSPAPAGAVELQMSFRVGPSRNWINLWKPAIDSLDPILGRTDPARPFHPRDDRVTRIGLHRVVDPALGHGIELAIWWRPAGGWVDQAPAEPAALIR